MLKKLDKLISAFAWLLKTGRQVDEIKINQGRFLAELNRHKESTQLNDYEFKIFSQWGEDGIIQFLISNMDIKNKSFIEFGVEDFQEANCRFLMMKDNWSGYVIDGSARNIKRLRSSYFYWRYSLQSKAVFITRENINDVLDESGFVRESGLFSIDIDGVDYHVLSALHGWNPDIMIIEYNAVFGSQRAVTVPYDPGFHRTRKHYSNLYYGASLPAFLHLLGNRGYGLVGVNSAGSNAFFVRKDLLNDAITEIPLNQCFRDSCFREGRNEKKELSFLVGSARRHVIADMPLIDVISGQVLRVKDLDG
jgi:hypothetical protein